MKRASHSFRANQVRLWLRVIAYNLGNLWRRLALPAGIEKWSLTSSQQRLVKTGGRLIKHAGYCWLLLAKSHLTRRLFGRMLHIMPLAVCRRDRRPVERSRFWWRHMGEGEMSMEAPGESGVLTPGGLPVRGRTGPLRGGRPPIQSGRKL